MMQSLLKTVLEYTPHQALSVSKANFDWQWLDEGVISFTPKTMYKKTVIISAGIHGNETAPIELLERIYQDICMGKLPLKVRLLMILGNPTAIRLGKRFNDYDINRLFCGGHEQVASNTETQRAKSLEQWVSQFFADSLPTATRYHYDLHTAIRESLLPTFALLPFRQSDYDNDLLASLDAANLDAVVYHNEAGKTFTHLTSEYLHAHSVTLELGKAKPFGQNDLNHFNGIDQVLRAIIANTPMPTRQASPIRVFKVKESIIKRDNDFLLNVAATAPNFTQFAPHTAIATQTSQSYHSGEQEVYVLFPNPNVAVGLRAGLLLKEVFNDDMAVSN